MTGHVTNCRMCDSANLLKFLDLGSMPPADRFLQQNQLTDIEERYPLEVLSCLDCGLAQLSYVVPPEILFCQAYPYEASTTATACQHWAEFAESTWSKLLLARNDLVVDIGSNVGVLLEAFNHKGARVVGVDPAANMADIANGLGRATIPAFFDEDVARRIVHAKGQASIITGTNVFAHIDDLNGFMRAVEILLKPEGTLVIESPHFMALVENLLYDTIYHEHLSYLSVKPLIKFFAKFGMQIWDIQRQSNHGESFRYFVGRGPGWVRPDRVTEILRQEAQAGIYDPAVLKHFAVRVEKNRRDLRTLLLEVKDQGSRIAAISAPAKGMTLLNYCGLGSEVLDFVTEKARLKIGRYTPGTQIPVVSDDMLREQPPDYALLLAWNFAEEIMGNLKAVMHNSKFIIPLPSPQIVN